ncbi:hypothetical protein [Streptomyces olivaceoviridis]|uniref:hypothetical protein n=1 Tax=Streptomyces olivaceoviridis TaxID=1921 RepID=UPI0036FD8D87
MVVVVAVAALGSRTAGVVAAPSVAAWYARGAAVIGHRLLTRPYGTSDITASPDIETAEPAKSAGSAQSIVDHVRQEPTELLGLRGCRFEYGNLMGKAATAAERRQRDGGRRSWDVDAAGWPEGQIELRACGNGHYLGRFLLAPGPGPVPSLHRDRS